MSFSPFSRVTSQLPRVIRMARGGSRYISVDSHGAKLTGKTASKTSHPNVGQNMQDMAWGLAMATGFLGTAGLGCKLVDYKFGIGSE